MHHLSRLWGIEIVVYHVEIGDKSVFCRDRSVFCRITDLEVLYFVEIEVYCVEKKCIS